MGIIVAHKFANIISVVDEIIILNDGEIYDKGSHNELLKRCDLYRKLLALV